MRIWDVIKPVFPDNIVTRRAKFFYTLFWHEYILNRGKNDVLNRFVDWTKEIGVLWLLYNQYFGLMPLHFALLLIVGGFILAYLIGLVYVKYQVDRVYSSVSLTRNEIYRRMYGSIKDNDKEEKL